MSSIDVLRAKRAELLASFEQHHSLVLNLQRQALDEILPDITEQLDLAKLDIEWAQSYLRDTGAIFRILKRHKFISSFAYNALRETLLWRFTTLKDVLKAKTSLRLYCLPCNVRDNLGRPIIVLRLSEASICMQTLRTDLLIFMERVRVFLQELSSDSSKEDDDGETALQYVLVIDVGNAPVKTMPVDLVTWYIRELQPRFHGLLATAFVINYSWTHSGVWGVTKHVIPSSAASRLIFLANKDFSKYLPASIPPPDFGGKITPLDEATSHIITKYITDAPPTTVITEVAPEPAAAPAPAHVSRFSILNPFFGYPIKLASDDTSFQRNVPELRHGRRRNRDLVRALSVLFWQKWKHRMGVGLLLVSIIGLFRISMRGRRFAFLGRV